MLVIYCCCWHIRNPSLNSSLNTNLALCFQLVGGDLMVKLFSSPRPPSTPPQMVGRIRKVSRSFCLHAPKGRDTDIPCGTHDIPLQFKSRPQPIIALTCFVEVMLIVLLLSIAIQIVCQSLKQWHGAHCFTVASKSFKVFPS